MTVRERKFWVRWYEAVEERRVMEAASPTTTTREINMGDSTPKFHGRPML